MFLSQMFESADWFNPYVGSMYWNSVVDGVGGTNRFAPADAITRAAMAKMLALGIAVSEAAEGEYARVNGESAFADYSDEEIVALITGTTTGELPEDELPAQDTSDSSLRVTLASNSPAGTTIPENGFNVPYTYLNFAAGSEEGVNITGLTISRTGLGAAGNFTNISLYDGLTQLSSEKTLSSQYNNATFNLNSSPIKVGAGSSKTIRVLGQMATPGAGLSNQLGVVSANDVTAVGAQTGGSVTVAGSFPIYGGVMTTSGARVGNMAVELVDPQGGTASTFYIGDQDRVFTRVTLSGNIEDMDVTSITFRQEGSVSADEVANIALYHLGNMVAGPAQMVDKYVTMELDEPIFLERGSSVTLELRGDIVGGFNKTVGFSINKVYHITAIGRVYGFPVVVNTPTGTIVSDNITGSRLSFSIGQRNPTIGDVAPGAKDFVGLQFNIINTGDTVDIKYLRAALTVDNTNVTPTMVSDVKIWRLDENYDFVNVVAGPVEPTGAAATTNLSFSDLFEIEANTTARFAITYDLSTTALTSGTVVLNLIDTKDASFEVRNVVTGDVIYNTEASPSTKYLNTAVTGNTRTVAKPSVQFTVASAPNTDAFVKNSTNVPVVGFNVKAGSADDVSVTSLTLTLVQDTTSTVRGILCDTTAGSLDSADFAAVKLYKVENGTETLLDGPREVSGTTVNFTGFQFDVPAGETAKMLVRANIPSSATSNVCGSFEIAANSDVSANDGDGRSLKTTAPTQITAAGVNSTPSSFILAASSGRIQVTASNETPNEGQVIAGATDVPVAKFKFEASTVEDVEIQKLRLWNADAATDADNAIKTVKLWDGDTLVASGTVTGGYVTWENLALVVPRNSSKTITVTVSFNDSNSYTAIAGLAPRFVIRNLEDNWVDNATAGGANGTGAQSTAAAGQNGDMKAVGKQSGQLLSNTEVATTDAVAGDRGFYTAANGNACDSAGYVTGAQNCGAAVTFVGNTLNKAQYVYNTKLTLSLEGGTNGTPVGNQGSAAGSGSEVTIFKFRVAATANTTASNPREVVLQDLYFTVSGDAEANNFKLYGPSNSSTPMTGGTSTVAHRTNADGTDGSSAVSGGHVTRTSTVPFIGLTGTDSKIAYGASKVYTLKANVYAITDNDSPVRNLRVYIDNYGTSAGASDVVWLDNGTGSKTVYWVYEEGVDELRPSSPMTYSTSSSYIAFTGSTGIAGGDGPLFVAARSLATNQVALYFDRPIIAVTGANQIAVDGDAAGVTYANVNNATVDSVNGNAIVASHGTTFNLLANTGAHIDTLVAIEVVGDAGTPGNDFTAAFADATLTPGF